MIRRIAYLTAFPMFFIATAVYLELNSQRAMKQLGWRPKSGR